jgi:uncharacterized membrane protein (DUF106 family)
MEELKDVYSLEFNSSQFQSEVQSAISRIEELNTAMEDGADIAGELEEAQGNLVSILGMEAKGIENLNAKRNVLVSTSKQLNAESKTGVVVGKQLDTTNKQIAVSTGNAAKAQRGFGASLLAGTRQISQMRRVASTLTFVFRAITAAIPFGLILSFAGPVISFFTSLFKSTDKTAENMEKLNDSTVSLNDKLKISKDELDKLNGIEAKRGKLTEEEKKRRQELTKVYEDTANEMVRIEEDRAERFRQIEFSLAEARVKILGDSSAGVIASAELETKKLYNEISRRVKDESKLVDEIYKQRIEAEKEYNATSDIDAQIRLRRLVEQEARAFKSIELLVEEQSFREQAIEQDKNKKLNDIAKRAADERARKEREELDRLKALAEDEFNMRKAFFEEVERREQEIAEERLRRYEAELASIKAMQKAYDDDLSALKSNLDEASKYRVDNAETNLNIALLNLEKERNAELLAAFGNAELQAEIDKEYNDKRAEFEKMANQEIIQIRIDFLKKLRDVSGGDPAALASINKQISELELKFAELGRVAGENIQETNSKFKELADEAGQAVQLASDTVFNVLNAQVQSYIGNLDRAVDKSRSALDEIRSNSENFNARQLEIEKERLERLEAERERAVQRERTLGQIQVGINAAIAISKAAAEGGGFASAFTIAATLASLIAGLAQARVAAGNAFFDGVEYLNRGNNPRGRDTIPAMLNEGERVITTDTNAKYWDVLSAVHNNRIPADVLNGFASAYQQGGLRAALGAFGDNISLSGELGQKAVFVNVAHNNSGLENRLERIESALMELPKYMPKTTVSANAKGIFRIVEQRQQRKDYSRNWAK